MINTGIRLTTLETLQDGGRRMKDVIHNLEFTICPFCYKDSPCASPVDEMWAMSCPKDYTKCSSYQRLIKK